MKINTKLALVNFQDKALKIEGNEDLTLGLVLANVILEAKEGGKMKMFILAEKLFKNKFVELDSADVSLITKALETTAIYNNLIAGQALLLLDGLKDKK